LNLVLFGPPGAGKGTQSQFIIKRFNLVHVSTGDLLRVAMKNKTSLGLEAKKFVDVGNLVPDSIMLSLIKEVIKNNKGKGLLLDGFPRNVPQAMELDQLFQAEKTPLDKAVFLEVDREILKARLIGRRVCATCGSAYQTEMKRPRVEGICDLDGGKLEHRKDDQPEVIDNRLEVYEKNTAPLKDYYKDMKKFVVVDGVGEPEVISGLIADAVLGKSRDLRGKE